MCDVHFGSKLVSYFSNLSTCVFLVSQILSHRQNTFYTADWQRFSSSVICIMNPVVKFSILVHTQNKIWVSKIISCTIKSQVLAFLVLKHIQTFSDCLWRGFLMLIWCEFLANYFFKSVTCVTTPNSTVNQIVFWTYLYYIGSNW